MEMLSKTNGTQVSTSATSNEGLSKGGRHRNGKDAFATVGTIKVRFNWDGSASDSSLDSRKSMTMQSAAECVSPRVIFIDKCPFAK